MEINRNDDENSINSKLTDREFNKATGVLNVQAETEHLKIFLKEGRIFNVEDMNSTMANRISALLLNNGSITKSELKGVHSKCEARLSLFSEELVSNGFINNDQRKRIINLIAMRILDKALTLEEGECKFQKMDDLGETEMESPLSATGLMMKSAKEKDEWPGIRRHVPSANSLFARLDHVTDDEWDEKLAALTAEDKLVANAINGEASVMDISDKLMITEFDVSHAVHELFLVGIVKKLDKVKSVTKSKEKSSFDFSSFRLHKIFTFSLALIVLAASGMLIWQSVILPVLNGESVYSVLVDSDSPRDVQIKNKTKMLMLKQGLITYVIGRGVMPTSLDVLVKERYCNPEDLLVVGGGDFEMKVIGESEETVIILGRDKTGDLVESLITELSFD